jgi:signal transduction histidine kinase
MTQIVRRILDYARRRPPRRAWIDASDLMRRACELLGGLAEQRRVVLSFEKGEETRLFADPDQLQQALTNLIMNAIQASVAGQCIRLTTSSAPPESDARSDGSFVVLAVEDAGPGITDEVRHRMFEPFFTTKPPGEGTGLGLSVVRDIVEEHGGFVDVSSRAGEGSIFKLHLPKDPKHAGASTDCR